MSETAQALLNFAQDFPQPTSSADSETDAAENSSSQDQADQVRCYRVPGFMIAEEKAILNQYQAEDVIDLLQKACDDFSLTSLFMRRFNNDHELDGFTVRTIGGSLTRPIAMLNKVCSIFADYEPEASGS